MLLNLLIFALVHDNMILFILVICRYDIICPVKLY